jgi:hypothetical protein
MPKLPNPAPKKPVAKRTITRKKKIEFGYDDVATRAYFLHLEGGGDQLTNWLQAERELQPLH